MTLALLAALVAVQNQPTDFLPPDTVAYAEFSNPSALPDAYTKYLERFAPPKSADALREKLAGGAKTLADQIREAFPELLTQETMRLALTVDSLHVAVVHIHGTQRLPEGVAVLALKDADAVKAFLADRVAPHAGETATIADRRAYRVGGEIWAAGSGRFAVAAKSLRDLGEALARGEKKSTTPGLANHPLFARLGPVDAGVPTLRFFIDIPRIVRQQLIDSTRNDAWQAEEAASIMRSDRLGGLLGRLTLADGALRLETRMDGENIVSDFIGTQPVSADAWTFIPPRTTACAGIGIKDARAFVQKLHAEFDRIDEIQKESGHPEDKTWAGFEKDVSSELDVTVDEIADTFGGEAVMFVGPLEGFMVHVPPIGLAVRGKDAAVLAKLVDRVAHAAKILENAEEFQKTAHKGVDIFHSTKDTMAFALMQEWLLLGDNLDVIKSMIDAHADGSKFAGYVRALPGGEAVQKKAGFFLALDTGAVAKSVGALGVLGGLGADDFAEGAVDIMGIWRDGDATVFGSTGTGITTMFTGVAPLALLSVGRSSSSGGPGETPNPQDVEPRDPPTAESIDPDPSMPSDAKARDAWIADKITDLNSDEPAKRDDATAALRRAGKLAAPAMGKAALESDNDETKARLMMLLETAGAYDQMPGDLVERTVDRLVSRLDKISVCNWVTKIEEDPADNVPPSISYYWDLHPLQPHLWEQRFKEESVLRTRSAAERLAKSLEDKSRGKLARRNIAALLALYDSAAAEKAVASRLDSESDKVAALYLRIALGWGTSDAARKITLDGLEAKDEWTRRAAFMAAERRPNAAIVDALVAKLDSTDPETRFNSAYTLRRATGSKVDVRPFAPKSERSPAVDAAHTANRDAATLREKTAGGDW